MTKKGANPRPGAHAVPVDDTHEDETDFRVQRIRGHGVKGLAIRGSLPSIPVSDRPQFHREVLSLSGQKNNILRKHMRSRKDRLEAGPKALTRSSRKAAMRTLTIPVMLVLGSGAANAAATNDGLFANAALRELHRLAVDSAQFERAAKDSDVLGCRDAYEDMQKAAHEALTNMHSMSFAPIDSIGSVSALLRVSQMSPDGCPDELVTSTDMLLTVAGQSIISLRYDYAIGDGDWYMINLKGDVEARKSSALRAVTSGSELFLG